MPNPITPSTFKELTPNGSVSFCSNFKKFLRFFSVFYQWVSYAFDDTGMPTEAFKSDLAGVTTVQVNSVPVKPTGLTASSDKSGLVALSWSTTSNATSYRVYRAETNTIPESPIATGVTSTSYTDEVAEGTYYYWIKAVNSLGVSPASDSATGTSLAGTPETDFTPVDDTNIGVEYTVEVPNGMTKLTVHAWAGGGGGAWGQKSPNWTPWPADPAAQQALLNQAGGGGGGGGGYAYRADIPVVAGEDVVFCRGAGGAIGSQGGSSYVRYNNADVLRCSGGNPGSIPTGGTGGSATGSSITKQNGGGGGAGNTMQGGIGGTAYDAGLTNQPPETGWGGDGSLYMAVGSSGGASAESGQPGCVLYKFS